jgi:hypothetical protein
VAASYEISWRHDKHWRIFSDANREASNYSAAGGGLKLAPLKIIAALAR